MTPAEHGQEWSDEAIARAANVLAWGWDNASHPDATFEELARQLLDVLFKDGHVVPADRERALRELAREWINEPWRGRPDVYDDAATEAVRKCGQKLLVALEAVSGQEGKRSPDHLEADPPGKGFGAELGKRARVQEGKRT